MELQKKALYEAPKVELISLGKGLNLIARSFSANGDVDDWEGGEDLDYELGGDDSWSY